MSCTKRAPCKGAPYTYLWFKHSVLMTFAKVLASAFKPATAITCVARTPSLYIHGTCSLSGGRVEAVEAVRHRDDAIAATTSR